MPLFELRCYTLEGDGPSRVVERLRDHMPPLFARHGFAPVAQWMLSGVSGDVAPGRLLPPLPAFVWMLAWRDHAARAAAFAGLYADPGFADARRATEPNGPWLTAMHILFLRPTPAHPAAGKPIPLGGQLLLMNERRPGAPLPPPLEGPQLLAHLEVESGWRLPTSITLTTRSQDDALSAADAVWHLAPLPHQPMIAGLYPG